MCVRTKLRYEAKEALRRLWHLVVRCWQYAWFYALRLFPEHAADCGHKMRWAEKVTIGARTYFAWASPWDRHDCHECTAKSNAML